MAALLQPPNSLNLKQSTNVSCTWKSFRQAYCNYEIASGVSEKEQRIRIATFLHVAGPEAAEKYNGFSWTDPADKMNIDKVIEKFDDDCSAKTNVISERYKFLKRKQQPNESCDQFVTQLRTLVSSCEYINPEEALRDQFVLQIRDPKCREKLLDQAQINATSLTFERAINLVKNFESTNKQHQEMNDAAEESTFGMNHKQKKPVQHKYGLKSLCPRCNYEHPKMKCPAYGQKCRNCNRFNHFEKCCTAQKRKRKDDSRQINNIENDENENYESEEMI